jgi:sulfofructose kinase
MIEALCIGHAAWDISAWVPEFPIENGKCEVRTLVECSGGPAANAACLLAKWGVRVGFIGALGADDAGERTQASLERFGVDTAGVHCFAGWPTPVSIILVNEQAGSRTIVNRTVGANQHGALTLNAFADESPRLLLFDGHELQASLDSMERWPEAHTMLDAGSLREGTRVLAGKVDHLVASERFACQLTGLSSLDSTSQRAAAIDALQVLNGHEVVITLGENGLIAGGPGTWRHIPALRADTIDSTGAGDIFHGALAFHLLRHAPTMELDDAALHFASKAAAASVEKRGSSPSIPDLEMCRMTRQ